MASVARTEKKELSQRRTLNGNVESVTSTSFANRFTILPTGVVSKKLMGACRIRANILKWRLDAERSVPSAIVSDAIMMDMAGKLRGK